ncbi:unnamed protein product [Chondrus crispus]|uniref:Uncharacterized protein n=1 Tax=Chondrus crispus TaxID=2769 RepID=R7QBD1_CHOCR|nr:unnamed protein product [Chondrus crispus]CDF35068.1 unnamed protein product [Chondrus crispus]|eukprot:XP_005714887.1 unnamed protein product [Chondrus crispus]
MHSRQLNAVQLLVVLVIRGDESGELVDVLCIRARGAYPFVVSREHAERCLGGMVVLVVCEKLEHLAALEYGDGKVLASGKKGAKNLAEADLQDVVPSVAAGRGQEVVDQKVVVLREQAAQRWFFWEGFGHLADHIDDGQAPRAQDRAGCVIDEQVGKVGRKVG